MEEIYNQWLDQLIMHPMFNNMDKDTLLHVLKCLKPKVQPYTGGEIIAIGGMPFDGVGIILKGQVQITKELISGQRHMMAKLSKQQMFGEIIAFSDNNVWPATVEALTDCIILFLPPNLILGTCTHACIGHNQLIRNMLTIISNKAIKLNRKVSYLSLKGMREKLASFLIEKDLEEGSKRHTFDIHLSREELAAYLNVSRPSMSRELSRMKEEGLIDYHKSSFKILNIEELTQWMS